VPFVYKANTKVKAIRTGYKIHVLKKPLPKIIKNMKFFQTGKPIELEKFFSVSLQLFKYNWDLQN
jgi:hypothetical protein